MSHVGKRPRERRGLRGRRRRAGLCLGRRRAGLQDGGHGEPTCTWCRKEIRLLIQAEERYTAGCPELNPQPGKDRGGSVPGGSGRPGAASADHPGRQTPQVQTAPLSLPMIFCTLSGRDPAPPTSVVGWLGWRYAHLSRLPTLGHLVEPEPGDSLELE